MNKGKKIVVAVRDAASGKLAVQRAMSMGKAELDRLVLVHVSRLATLTRILELRTAPFVLPDGEYDPDRYAWLRGLAEFSRIAGFDTDLEILEGDAGTAIADFARQEDASFIVVATHRDGQARELFVGSTALRTLRSAPCPVIVARGRVVDPYRRALIAIDLDDTGQRVALASTALLGDLEFELVHAYRVPQEGQLRMRGVGKEELAGLREFVAADLKPRLEAYRAAFPSATIHLEHGYPASVVLAHALRLRPDVLVLGKHRGPPREERVLGSVTQYLLYSCPTDLLLVP